MRGVEQIPWLYDGLCRVFELAGLRKWREALLSDARGRTLEVGCGTGRNLPRYPKEAQVIGLDPSLDALRRARARAPQVPLVCGSAEALPFADGTFDTVVSSLVFCSVGDPARGLAETRRVLKKGGLLRMLEHVRSTRRPVARLQDFIQPAWTWVAGGCHPNRDTEATVQAAGFGIDEGSRRAQGTLRLFSARAQRPS